MRDTAFRATPLHKLKIEQFKVLKGGTLDYEEQRKIDDFKKLHKEIRDLQGKEYEILCLESKDEKQNMKDIFWEHTFIGDDAVSTLPLESSSPYSQPGTSTGGFESPGNKLGLGGPVDAPDAPDAPDAKRQRSSLQTISIGKYMFAKRPSSMKVIGTKQKIIYNEGADPVPEGSIPKESISGESLFVEFNIFSSKEGAEPYEWEKHTKNMLKRREFIKTLKVFKSDGNTMKATWEPVGIAGKEIEKRLEEGRLKIGGISFEKKEDGSFFVDDGTSKTHFQKKEFEEEQFNLSGFTELKEMVSKYFMYVLLDSDTDTGYTLRMHEYKKIPTEDYADGFQDWYSKHGVILHTAKELNFKVVCAGIFKDCGNFIYMDNLSGTLSPRDEQLMFAKRVVQKAFNKKVFTCTIEDIKGIYEQSMAHPELNDLLRNHPDSRTF